MARSNLNRIAKDRRGALLSLLYQCGGDEYFLSPSETYDPLATYFDLSDSERNEIQNENRGDFRNHWEILLQNTRQQLVNRGLIDKSKREIWKLTEKGITEARKISTGYEMLVNMFEQKNNKKIRIQNHSFSLVDKSNNEKPDIMERSESTSQDYAQLLNLNTIYSVDINEPSDRIISVNYRIVRDTIISQKII